MLFNKRASLEISIQAIVIVVLAMTLLGLGLGFIKGMFGNIDKLASGTFDKISDQLQRDLTISDQKLIFSQTKVSIERGESVLLGWGINNRGTAKLNYWAEFTPIKCPGTCPTLADLNEDWFTFKYNPTGVPEKLYSIDAADQAIVRVDLSIPKDADTGLYLVDLSIYDKDNANAKYASTEIFITIT